MKLNCALLYEDISLMTFDVWCVARENCQILLYKIPASKINRKLLMELYTEPAANKYFVECGVHLRDLINVYDEIREARVSISDAQPVIFVVVGLCQIICS